MEKRIDAEELRSLNDNKEVRGEKGKMFNLLFKKNKLSKIKFESNSKSIWIFPFSQEIKDYSYKYTEPHPKFLKYIQEEEVQKTLKEINLITRKYYDKRFLQENSKEFPNFKITQIALCFILLGFILQMYRLFNINQFTQLGSNLDTILFYTFLSPWLLSLFILYYMFYLLSKNKNVNYNTDFGLYSKIDGFFFF